MTAGLTRALESIKQGLVGVLAYLGSAAHRRAVAVLVSMVAAKVIGHALDADTVANGIDLFIGVFGGAWSKNTPAIQAEAEVDHG